MYALNVERAEFHFCILLSLYFSNLIRIECCAAQPGQSRLCFSDVLYHYRTDNSPSALKQGVVRFSAITDSTYMFIVGAMELCVVAR